MYLIDTIGDICEEHSKMQKVALDTEAIESLTSLLIDTTKPGHDKLFATSSDEEAFKVSIIRTLASITGRNEQARERIILNTSVVNEIYNVIKSSSRQLQMVGCKILISLGRSDKVRKNIIYE